MNKRNPDLEFRTSESCMLEDSRNPLVHTINQRLADTLGIDLAYSEVIQGQRYRVGQQFKAHLDAITKTATYYNRHMNTLGQRTWTFMIFLNEPEDGGETYFPKVDIGVTPKTGRGVIWNNLLPDGEINRYALHQGKPVIKGEKHIITKWFRERPAY